MRPESELYRLEVGVHLRIHSCVPRSAWDVLLEQERRPLTSDGTVDDSPVLELDRDRLVIELHQKPKAGTN